MTVRLPMKACRKYSPEDTKQKLMLKDGMAMVKIILHYDLPTFKGDPLNQ